MSKTITILLVDDHTIVRQGVRAFLEAQSDMQIVGEAASGEEAVQLVRKLTPDVVLMDLIMPGMSGIQATRQIKQVSPRTQVIVLTSFGDDENIFPALRAGALSYILKDIRPGELIDIVRKAAQGDAVLHSQVVSRVIQQVRAARREIPAPFTQLTERELDILRLIAEGQSNAAIAEKLVLSEKTVKGHITNILSKLQVEDRTQAAILAWQQGLMSEK